MDQLPASSAMTTSDTYGEFFKFLYILFSEQIFKNGWTVVFGKIETYYEMTKPRGVEMAAAGAWERIRIRMWILLNMSLEFGLNDTGSTYSDLMSVFPETRKFMLDVRLNLDDWYEELKKSLQGSKETILGDLNMDQKSQLALQAAKKFALSTEWVAPNTSSLVPTTTHQEKEGGQQSLFESLFSSSSKNGGMCAHADRTMLSYVAK